jgi:glycosyltransferase involved in cell wall biosynthesis
MILPKATWIALSPAIAASFPPAWTVRVVRNPIPEAVERRVVRERGGEPLLRVGWLGAIAPEKGVDLLLQVADARSDVEFTMAGDLGAIGQLPDSVRYVGRLERAEALRFWTDKDVFILPSRVPEGLPLAVLEGLEAAVVVGATPSLGLNDLIAAGAVARILPSCESISAFLTSLRDPDDLNRVGQQQQAAWNQMRGQFERREVVDSFERCINEVAGM